MPTTDKQPQKLTDCPNLLPISHGGPGENNGWLPIATAPKNGECFLACNFQRSQHSNHAPFYTVWHCRYDDEKENIMDVLSGEGMVEYFLTHWQPLPRPPA